VNAETGRTGIAARPTVNVGDDGRAARRRGRRGSGHRAGCVVMLSAVDVCAPGTK
jgi:hypothetical protein